MLVGISFWTVLANHGGLDETRSLKQSQVVQCFMLKLFVISCVFFESSTMSLTNKFLKLVVASGVLFLAVQYLRYWMVNKQYVFTKEDIANLAKQYAGKWIQTLWNQMCKCEIYTFRVAHTELLLSEQSCISRHISSIEVLQCIPNACLQCSLILSQSSRRSWLWFSNCHTVHHHFYFRRVHFIDKFHVSRSKAKAR